jgi:predicted nucleic acid-binding protein
LPKCSEGDELLIERRDKYLRLFLRDADKQYKVVPINSRMIRVAINLTQEHKLRGYDAVHLATALIMNAELLRKQLPPLTFVAADGDLLEAAEAEGDCPLRIQTCTFRRAPWITKPSSASRFTPNC